MRRLPDLLRRRLRMLKEDALAVAQVVEDAFQGQAAVEDDDLDAHLRQLFYDLQDMGVMEVQRREYTQDGRLLRGYEWHIRDEDVLPTTMRPAAPIDPEVDVYGSLKDDAWERRRPAPA